MRIKLSVPKIVPTAQQKIVPSQLLGQRYGTRKYLKLQDIFNFAGEYFDKTKKGINFSLLQRKFGLSKSKAQESIKEMSRQSVVIYCKRYYSTNILSSIPPFQVIEHIKKENVSIGTTGTSNLITSNLHTIGPSPLQWGTSNSNLHTPLDNCIEHQKANNFLDFLVQLQLRLRPCKCIKFN